MLFDLDGTLLDTAHDMIDALNALRAEENLAPLPYEKVRCQVSHGGHALVRLSFGTLPPTEHEAMRMRLLDIYRKQLAKHTCLFEGGDEMLRRPRTPRPCTGASSRTSPAGSPIRCWSK